MSTLLSPDSFHFFEGYAPQNEIHLRKIQLLAAEFLSEPYSLFTFRSFSEANPTLTKYLIDQNGEIACGVIGKTDLEQGSSAEDEEKAHGYIGMVVTAPKYRRRGLARYLLLKELKEMEEAGLQSCVIETETNNKAALAIYESLGFSRERVLYDYYLTGSHAFRLRLWFPTE